MTTPERLRRRQRRETALVVLTIVLVIASGIWDNRRDDAQEECFANTFSQFVKVSKERGALVQRESEATSTILLTSAARSPALTDADRMKIARYIKLTELHPETAELPKAKQRALIMEYVDEVTGVRQARIDAKLPDFPKGTCD